MPEVLRVDDRVQVTTTAKTRKIKDPTYSNLPRRPRAPTTIPLASSEGLLVHTNPIETQ